MYSVVGAVDRLDDGPLQAFKGPLKGLHNPFKGNMRECKGIVLKLFESVLKTQKLIF